MQTPRALRLLGILLPILLVVARGQIAVAVPPTTISVTPGSGIPVAVPALPTNLPPSVIPASGSTSQPLTAGETSLTLDVANGLRAVPPSRVSVPVGETLRITGPSSAGRPVQWSKNGKDLSGATTNPLVISSVLTSDAGTYAMAAMDPLAATPSSQTLILGVGPTPRLANVSNRGLLAAGAGQIFTTGFVVGGGATTESKKIIIRAIGPSLTAFGITNPLRYPVLRVFDATGKAYNNGYVYSPVTGGPTYESDLATSINRVGAFPIPASTLDAVIMLPFPPGAYTAQVSSGDNTAGEVLLEIYEVP